MRELTKDEEAFMHFVLGKVNSNLHIPKIVVEMKDGGMGSLSFDLDGTESRFDQVVGGEFTDVDGTLVDFEVTVTSKGALFELDFWKVDFSPLVRFPKTNEIRIRTTDTASPS